MPKPHSISVVFFEDFEFDVDLEVAPAEPDVGIFHPYVEDWTIAAVDGNTNHSVLLFFTNKIESDKQALDLWKDILNESI